MRIKNKRAEGEKNKEILNLYTLSSRAVGTYLVRLTVNKICNVAPVAAVTTLGHGDGVLRRTVTFECKSS